MLWWTVFIPLFTLYAMTLEVSWFDLPNDPQGVSPSAWNVAHHLTSRFSPDKTPLGPFWLYWIVPSGHGQLVTNRPPGLIWLGAIFYRLSPASNLDDQVPISLAAALVTAAGVATLAVVARRLVSAKTALATGFIIGAATNMWAIAGRTMWPHGPDTLYLSIAILATSSRRYVIAGIGYGLGILTRQFIALPGATVGIWHAVRERSFKTLIAFGLPQAFFMGVVVWYSRTFWNGSLFGNYETDGGNASATLTNFGWSGLRAFGVNIVGTFVSPGLGVFVYSPFLLALVPGVRAAWRVAPDWVRSAGVASGVYLVLHLKTNRFSGGVGFWTYRYALEPLVLLTPLLVLAWREWTSKRPRRQGAFFALLVISVSFECLGALSFRQPYPRHPEWNFTSLNVALYRLPYLLMPVILFGTFLLAFYVYVRVSRTLMRFEKKAKGAPTDEAANGVAETPKPLDDTVALAERSIDS